MYHDLISKVAAEFKHVLRSPRKDSIKLGYMKPYDVIDVHKPAHLSIDTHNRRVSSRISKYTKTFNGRGKKFTTKQFDDFIRIWRTK